MRTVRLFSQWVDLFAFKFYLDSLVPINHTWHQKTRGTGLPDGEDRIPARSLVLTQYRSVTDGQTDGFAVAYTALAKLALPRCKNEVRDDIYYPVRQRSGAPCCHFNCDCLLFVFVCACACVCLCVRICASTLKTS